MYDKTKSTLFTAQVKESIEKQRAQLKKERENERTQFFARNANIRTQETMAAGYQPLKRR